MKLYIIIYYTYNIIIKKMVIKLSSNPNSFCCYYDIKLKYLHLHYPSIEEQTEECWEKNIMDMHEQYPEYNIIENTEHIFLEIDFYYSFPQVFLKFMNLKKLVISGSRWWNLNCNQIPISVEHLILTEHTNLQNDVMKGGECLINLHTLELDGYPFFESCDFSDYEINNFEFYNKIYKYTDTYPIPGSIKYIKLYQNHRF